MQPALPQDEPFIAQPFVTRPLSVWLDVVRAAAATVVLVFHAAQTRLYTGPFPDFPMAQHYAVVVFFVLSGLVITTSVSRKRGTLRSYALARAARILPVSLVAMAFSTLAYLIAVRGFGASPLHADTYGQLTLPGTLLPVLFLSESPFGAGPVWNPPYWSLCYEVWYYALFGAAVFLRGGKRVAALAVLAALTGPRILLLLPIWLLGVVLARAEVLRRVNLWQGLILLAAGLLAAWLHTGIVFPAARVLSDLAGEWRGQLGFSRFALSDFLLGLAVCMVFIGLRPVANRWPGLLRAIERPAKSLAGFSFTLYLFHWPMLNILRTVGVSAGESPLAFAALIAALIGICYAVSLGTERQRDRVRGWMERLLPQPLAIRHPAA